MRYDDNPHGGRDVGIVAKPSRYLHPVHTRHAVVKEHHVERLPLQRPERLHAVLALTAR
jgi:hypothetical protein